MSSRVQIQILSGLRWRRAKGLGKGIHLASVRDDALVASPDFGGSLMPIVPEIGYVRCRSGEMTGRGRWDARNEIFRRVILCPKCEGDSCNQRQWAVCEQHRSRLCKSCHREAGSGVLRLILDMLRYG